MSDIAIKLNDPNISPFSDGQFYRGGRQHRRYQPARVGYAGFPTSYHFWEVPAITPAVGERHPTVYSLNKRIVYINGIMTPMQSHAQHRQNCSV